jgi:hypothetical protein
MSDLRSFGPFVEIPCELIKNAGFSCRTCRRPVERFAQAIPYGVPRMVFHACGCGCVVVWEDEIAIKHRHWRSMVALLQRSGAEVLMINGNNPLEESFSGVN